MIQYNKPRKSPYYEQLIEILWILHAVNSIDNTLVTKPALNLLFFNIN